MFEEEIIIPVGSEKLAGTMCLPEDSGVFPVVLMVHGSGPVDRNENAKGLKLNIFNTIAHYLADLGIASLRYDKRGVGKSTGNFYLTGHVDLVNDALHCVDYLKTNKRCDAKNIFVLGHSEGSIIVPQLCQRDSKLAGIIMIAPFIENIETVLINQAEHVKVAAYKSTGLSAAFARFLFKFIDPVKSQKKLIRKLHTTTKRIERFMFSKLSVKWFREIFSIDPPEVYRNSHCATLIIAGGKDIQCNPDDVGEIKKVIGGDVEAHIINDLTHILRLDKNDASIFNYKKLLKLPMEPLVLETISGWLQKQRA